MGESGLRVVRIREPKAFAMSQVRTLFETGFKNDEHADFEEVLEWCAGVVYNEAVFVAIAIDKESMVAFTIASYDDGPFGHDPFSIFTYSGHQAGFDSVIWAMREWSIRVSGGTSIRFVNSSGRSDEWYLNRIGHFADGRVVGSLIHCDWGELPTGMQGDETWDQAEALLRSPRTSHPKHSEPSAGSSPTSSSIGLRAAVRRLMGRLRLRSRRKKPAP